MYLSYLYLIPENIYGNVIDINPHQTQIFTDIYLMIIIHSLFNKYGLRFCSAPGIVLGTG